MATRSGSPPDLDLARIRRFAQNRLPASLANEVRLEIEVEGPKVTIVERRPPWQPDFGPEWSRQPIAQLRFDAARATWALFWPRANGRRQRYELPRRRWTRTSPSSTPIRTACSGADVREVFDVLDALGIPWFVTGSEAAACYGVLRQTFDTDVVVNLQPTEFEPIARALPGFAIAQPIEFDDFARASVVSKETAGKVDLILRQPSSQARRVMDRRRPREHREHGQILGVVPAGPRGGKARVVGRRLRAPASRLRAIASHQRADRGLAVPRAGGRSAGCWRPA